MDPSLGTSDRRLGPGSRVLLVRLRSLGDTVLMTPVVAALKRLPDVTVGVVVETPFHQVLAGNRDVDRTIVVSQKPIKLAGRLRALHEIREFRPDVVIDLHGGTTSSYLTFLSGATVRAGYATSRNSRLYNLKIPDSRQIWGKPGLHTVEHQLATVKFLGCPVDPLPPLQVKVASESLRRVKSRLDDAGIRDGFLLVQPAAAFSTKQWAAERFAEVLRRLSNSDLDFVVTAGPGQESLLQAIRDLGPARCHYLLPMAIPDFVALTSLCRLYLGNDTGATHIAAALGRDIVVIFGSSDWKVWHPWGVRHQLVRADLPCAPCPGYRCLKFNEPRCILSVEVEQVVAAVKALL